MPKRLKHSKQNGMDDSSKPSKIPITCLIPRFGAWGGAIVMLACLLIPRFGVTGGVI